jgi:glycine/D-amino acid oxidase-like deaminating enzyme
MAFTRDFTPSVGIMGEDRNLYYGVAYNGEGVAFTQTAGRIIAGLVAGEQSEFTRLFVVNHRMPYLGPSSVRFLFERLYRWYLTRGTENPVR